MVQSFYRRHLQNTTNNVTGAQEDHDRSRYAAYSVNRIGRVMFVLTRSLPDLMARVRADWPLHINLELA